MDLGDGFYLLDNVTDPTSVLVKAQVSPTQWARLMSSANYGAELQTISKSVYTKFHDDFDFLFFVLDTVQESSIINALGFYGVNHRISNNIAGIGSAIFNGTAAWGSAGKLKSAMYFPCYNAIAQGPTLHELCHNWAAFIVPTFAPDNTDYSGHWGVSNAGGQLGGFNYVRTVETNSGGVAGKTKYQASMKSDFSTGFGTNANGGNGVKYSDIELYLMGMKSAQELRDAGFHLDIYSGNSYDSSFSDGYFYSTNKTVYTVDDLIASQGARVPDAATSQKHFKVLTVVLTGGTTHHYADIAKAVKWVAGGMSDNSYPGWTIYNFTQATNGVGTLEVAGITDNLIAKPTALLGNLSVSTGTLSPAFDSYKLSYTVNVAQNVTDITLTATKDYATQTIIGDGAKTLDPGKNTFNIEVTANDGATKTTYTVNVIREFDACSAPNNVFPWVVGFELGMPSCFTLVNGYSSWQVDSNKSFPYWSIPAHEGNYAYINDDVNSYQDNGDVWMKLPALDFTDLTAATLKFDNYRSASYGGAFTIKASTDGITWTDLKKYTNSVSNWQTDSIALTSYEGEASVYIAFHYNDQGQWADGWAVDNIKVKGTSAVPTGIADVENSSVKLYPTPATDNVTISGIQGDETIRFFDSNGRTVIIRQATGTTENIETGQLPKGVYIVRIGTQTLKLVKN
ncbi:hypothetical protein FACS1894162_0960 [Bacteroidia bacterium]|nr:hypothetical protein FACS1894162_0960 [Bacteroidia bacterium]